jgi:hypothetical protein
MRNQIRKLKIEVPPVKYSVSPVKYVPNDEVVLVFVEKSGSRFMTRIKIDNIASNYFFENDINLPFPAEKELHLNLMKVLGFCLLYFYIYIFILINLVFYSV